MFVIFLIVSILSVFFVCDVLDRFELVLICC